MVWFSDDDHGNGRNDNNNDSNYIIYPFVSAGTTYTFVVEFQGTGLTAQATIQAQAGIGEMIIPNKDNLGLIYNSATRTMSLTETPIKPVVAANPKILDSAWYWEFFRGRNINEGESVGMMWGEDPILSAVFDGDFDSYILNQLRGQSAFVVPGYAVLYGEHIFWIDVSPPSSPFMFPNFFPITITTAFETNENIILNYQASVWLGGDGMGIGVGFRNYPRNVSFMYFVNGIQQEGFTESWARLPTTDMKLGINYGLVIVIIDGVAFAQEFVFQGVEW
jgi:hypothetical protein